MKRAWSDLHGRTLPLAAVSRRSGAEAADPERSSSCVVRRVLRAAAVILAALVVPRTALAHPGAVHVSRPPARSRTRIDGTLVAHMFDLGARSATSIRPERLLDPAVAAQQSAAIARLFAATADRRSQRRDADAAVVGGRSRRRSAVAPAWRPLRAVGAGRDRQRHRVDVSLRSAAPDVPQHLRGACADAGDPRPRPHRLRVLRRHAAGRARRDRSVSARRHPTTSCSDRITCSFSSVCCCSAAACASSRSS